MKRVQENRQNKIPDRVYVILLSLALIIGMGAVFAFAAESSANNRYLQNGSFEDGPSFTGNYSQPNQSLVPYWNTTATDGRIELLKQNDGVYIKGVTVQPTAGTYAAELNADEESTLYQNVKTSPSSIYEWGLDHGARNGTDIMALVIGPNQSVAPAKPSKAGRDQFMQMIDWLLDNGEITYNEASHGLCDSTVVYSKKFAASGTFADNAGNNAFSMTPSTIYTEKWCIWIIADSSAATGTNPWGSYGSNADGSAGSGTGTGGKIDLTKEYLYTVPAGQTDTLFAFVSVGFYNPAASSDKAKTYGNFLDNINFRLYHALSGSSSTHGSAVISGSDGASGATGSNSGHKITVDNKLATYIADGEQLKIQAIVKKDDADDGCEFVGVYCTSMDENGASQSNFLKLAGNVIDDTGSLTDEEKAGKWLRSTNDDGDLIYTYYLDNLTSSTDLHFIFVKSPTVTYDPNGGKPYVVERTYNTNEAANVYSFKPVLSQGSDPTTFIAPYVSKAAQGQNDGWKFMGWLLTGDTVDGTSGFTPVNPGDLGSKILPAVHTIACDYAYNGIGGDSKTQFFKIYDGETHLTKTINGESQDAGVTWTGSEGQETYANAHKGLTMVAQWRWRQAFIPQMSNGSNYIDSDAGGSVEIITDTTSSNYDGAYGDKGGKAYYAATDEVVNVRAVVRDQYSTFEGWYDQNGNLVTTKAEYSYIETKESVNTYYARFSRSVTQTYIRQVRSGDTWVDTTDDKIGTLGRYTYVDAPGNPISSTATAKSGYKFVGWYDAAGVKVADSMLQNEGATISYTTTGDATYYARFEKTYTVKFVAQTKQADGTFKTDTTGGKVSVASASDVENAYVSSTASRNTNYRFLGWYDSSGTRLSTSAKYSPQVTTTNGITYYARFEIVYNPKVESKVYLSFVAESKDVTVPGAFAGRDTGAGVYGLDSEYGNTISTGFKYSLNTTTYVKTIQITVTVPSSAYVKVGGTGSFTGSGTSILTDSAGVVYNRGSIQQISGGTTLTYYWDATGLQANTTYGFVIDNLYAPGATATITVNGTDGTQVTNANGVVNTASGSYRNNSHYTK